MLKSEREQELLQLLQETGYISVQDLSRKLYTSESTIRRVLAELARKGLVRRSYGGVELLEHFSPVAHFQARTKEHAAAKQDIAKKAAALVPDGSIVFLDQSSTAYFLADALRSRKNLTVVTNNIEIASLLSRTDFEVFVSGGHLSQQMRMCLVGEDAHRTFRQIHADFVFFSARSLSETGIVSDCDRAEICVRNAMLENARQKVFLCDSSKFGGLSGFRQCALSELDILISEGDQAHRFAAYRGTLQIL